MANSILSVEMLRFWFRFFNIWVVVSHESASIFMESWTITNFFEGIIRFHRFDCLKVVGSVLLQGRGSKSCYFDISFSCFETIFLIFSHLYSWCFVSVFLVSYHSLLTKILGIIPYSLYRIDSRKYDFWTTLKYSILNLHNIFLKLSVL